MFARNNLDLAELDKLLKTCGETAEVKYDLNREDHQSKLRELAMIVCASAIRLGVTDLQKIFKVINAVVDAILSDVSGLNNEEAASIYLQGLSDLIQTLNKCDVDCLMYHFIQEINNKKNLEAMSIRLIALNAWNNPHDLPDWMGIYRLMSNDTLVLHYMDQLENELQQFVAKLPVDWQFPRREDGKFVMPDYNEYSCYKLLSNFMYQWATENGFKQTAKLIGTVSTSTFYSALASQSFIKDSGFGGAHGIFIHGKQWYAVVEHYKKTWFLKSPPLEIYQRLGDTKLLTTEKSLVRNPWDILFDSFKENCTSPETMTGYVRNDEHRWPLLGGTANRHTNKKRDNKTSAEKLQNKHAHDAKDGMVIRPFRSKL